jgi:hypothetical protein
MIGSKLIKRFLVLCDISLWLKIDHDRCPESDITLARHNNRWGKTELEYIGVYRGKNNLMQKTKISNNAI